MPNKMLIDATHPEETRVVVVRGNRVEEFDFETTQRKQLRGNIYLAKVTRVEPSLQAAFIEYGGNRHGFLAFSEIHPDYYQIPVADRQALIEEDARAHRAAEVENENRSNRRRRGRNARRRGGERVRSEVVETETGSVEAMELNGIDAATEASGTAQPDVQGPWDGSDTGTEFGVRADHAPATEASADDAPAHDDEAAPHEAGAAEYGHDDAAEPAMAEPTFTESAAAPGFEGVAAEAAPADDNGDDDGDDDDDDDDNDNEGGDEGEEEDVVESVGGADALEEVPERAFRPRARQYKIQEVIKRRQVMLVQVVKEERGNKGAALTTYLSLAGRYSVLMPNTARGGGISRKITSAQDRARLKEVVSDLDVPEGMGIILRTAGAARAKAEIHRDFEYLLRMWETVRDLTLQSQAPSLVYEEGSLIKRSIRDLYNKDIDEVLVAGEAGYHEARDFMRMLMPSHARAVKLYRDSQPLFSRIGVESQLDAMFSPVVQLRSGGYLVINQTEALVSIDVNSGRATREHHIEDTALKTNLEAAEEIARQLRLRDLAGLIVIDFIDMDEKRNNRAVERRLSDNLKHDRARIQVGRISHFGLLEMSRQRIRASVLESSTEPCAQCGGSGHVRSVSSVALQLLRSIEEILVKGATHNLVARTRTDVALYVLNHKRAHLRSLEERFKVILAINADASMSGAQAFVIDRGEQVHTLEAAKALLAAQAAADQAAAGEAAEDDFDSKVEAELDEEVAEAIESEREESGERETGEGRGRRRRRRRPRGGRGGDEAAARGEAAPGQAYSPEDIGGEAAGEDADEAEAEGDEQPHEGDAATTESERRRRRRGRRGGRRRRTPEEGSVAAITDELSHTASDDFDLSPEDLAAHAPAPRAPIEDEPPAPPQPPAAEAAPAPAPSPAAPAPAPADSEQAATRRRSTVREPVKFTFDTPTDAAPPVPPAAPTPPAPPEPPAPSATPADTAAPRRAGWWSRRFGSTDQE
ncbi:MAG: ribonuclease E/G [Xanthobacteraceae bacterium]|nr:MAG: ribonuclease E/G [Xanthobacteraceae bacterium]